MTKLSKDAESALLAAHGRRGALIQSSRSTLAELQGSGLAGDRGLTDRGVTERERIMRRREDEAFGE